MTGLTVELVRDGTEAVDLMAEVPDGFFDLIFMDPPYHQNLEAEILQYLARSSIVKDGAMIIVEADEHTDFSYVEALGYAVQREKIYKTNKHVFLTLRTADAKV